MAVQTRKPAPTIEGVNFGDLGMYTGGGVLPKGDYVLFFDVRMFAGKQSTRAARLGVMVTAFPLEAPTQENAREQFYSMGSNADKSFAPNPETGKGIVPIPGAAGSTLNLSTNWIMLLKSMYDCGLPQGVFTNDLTVLDGVHVHMDQIDEPEERAGFRSQTGEAAMEGGNRGPNKVAIITEIKDDGKPWEGTGGIPEATTPVKKTVAAAPKVNGKPAPVAPPAEVDDDETLLVAAQNAISAVLSDAKYAKSIGKLVLKTQTFATATKAADEKQANAITKTFFANDEALSGVLGPLGYQLNGAMVIPIPA